MNTYLVSFRNNTSLFIWMKHRYYRRYKESGGRAVVGEQIKDFWHANSGTIFALTKLTGRMVAPTESLSFMIRIKRERNSNSGPIWPSIRIKRFTSSDLIYNFTPLFLWPAPAFRLVGNRMSCFFCHLLCPSKNNPITLLKLKEL